MKKILIVDDDMEILNIISVFLKRQKLLVVTETDELKVIAIVGSLQPDLILLDVNLPNKWGTEVCLEVKAKFRIPIILFSAQLITRGTLKKCHADDFIEKPFHPNFLLTRIWHHISQAA